MATETSTPQSRPARRTIVKGAAWAVPVVTVASATPAFAVSPDPIEFTGVGCKVPNSGPGAQYFFELSVDPTVGPASIPFTFSWSGDGTMTHNGQQPGSYTLNVVNVPVGETRIIIRFNNTANAANGTLTINYTYLGVDYSTTIAGEFSADCHNRGIVPFGAKTNEEAKDESSASDESTSDVIEEPVADVTPTEVVEQPAADEATTDVAEEPAVEETVVDEAPAGADTASTTASPDNR